jgi:predicted PurR-regulated permease PerM
LTNSASSLTELLIALSFMPFLVYFVLSWKDRLRVATVKLFSPKHRPAANETLDAIASMLHGFIVGNLLCGLFVSGGCVLAFSLLKIPYFYFLGFISGFLSLIPYLGTFLAMLPPLAAGIGTLSGAGILAVAVIVFVLDMFAINVLFPKMIGKRLQFD